MAGGVMGIQIAFCCDGCGWDELVSASQVPTARKQVSSKGWFVAGSESYCPSCKAEPQKRYEEYHRRFEQEQEAKEVRAAQLATPSGRQVVLWCRAMVKSDKAAASALGISTGDVARMAGTALKWRRLMGNVAAMEARLNIFGTVSPVGREGWRVE